MIHKNILAFLLSMAVACSLSAKVDKYNYNVEPLVKITGLSRLPPNLDAMRFPVFNFTLDTVTSSSIFTLDASASNVDQFYTGDVVVFGPATQNGIDQAPSFYIVDYQGATRQVTLAAALPDLPTVGDAVTITVGGTWYRNTSDECWIAVNPRNPFEKIMCTHQDFLDPHATGFLADIYYYTKDDGQTWNQSNLVFSRDQGATTAGANDDFESASDPSVAYDRFGNSFALSISFNSIENFEEANVLGKSTDGGASWNQITAVTRDDGSVHFLDSPRVQTDPYRKNVVYVTSSDDIANIGAGPSNNVTIQISQDGGNTFTLPIITGQFGQADSNITSFLPQLVVLNDVNNTLVIMSLILVQAPVTPVPQQIVIMRSTDSGVTWTQSIAVDAITATNPIDPQTGASIATGDAQIAINTGNNYLYVVYQTHQFSVGGNLSGIGVTMSKDGGLTWSNPVVGNPNSTNTQAFLPSVAVANDGTVAVMYYDTRNYTGGANPLLTDVWVSFFDKNLNFKNEVRLTPQSFDIRQALVELSQSTTSPGYIFFIGDYARIVNVGNDFNAVFSMTDPALNGNPINPTANEILTQANSPFATVANPYPANINPALAINRQNTMFSKITLQGCAS